MKVFVAMFFLASFFCYADNFDGSYSLSNASDCDKMLYIDIKNNFFSIYSSELNIKGKKLVTKGTLDLLKNNANIYLKMGSIEALYNENHLVIQNSGNSMNDYNYFDFCDYKYLIFNEIPD